jgi:glycosyltransferase involved in cell wall biosynthesis
MSKKYTNGHSTQKAFRIGIDARLYDESGIGRYIRNLLQHLSEIDTYNHYYVFLLKKNMNVKLPRNIVKVEANFGWYGVTEQVQFPRLLSKYELDLMHFPHFNVPMFYRGKFVVTIHDLIHQHFAMNRSTTLNPLTYRVKRAGYGQVFNRAVHNAAKVIVPSEYVKGLLQTEWNVNEDQVVVTHEAVEENLTSVVKTIRKEEFDRLAKKFKITGQYLYYVGNAHPHKNVEKLLEAFEQIRKKNPNVQLVMSGPDHYFWQRIIREHPNIEGVIYTGFVTDRELIILFKNATCYVMPSLEEGFGIPILEAMACGTPVACSDVASLPEVGGDACVFFDPSSVDDMAKKISKLLGDKELQKRLVANGIKRYKQFSWDKLAEQTLSVYKQASEK